MVIAVLDLGTARAKLLIAERGETAAFELYTREMRLVGASRADVSGAASQIRELLGMVEERHCEMLITVGTEYFRSGEFNSILTEALTNQVEVNVLSTQQESRLFFASVQLAYSPNGPVVAADVGGGSVQLCWADAENGWASLPIGTFSLERRFQALDQNVLTPDSTQFKLMQSYIREEVSRVIPGMGAGTLLFVGSNVMEDFFSSCMAATGIYNANNMVSDLLEPRAVYQLSEAIIGRRYTEIENYFPQNPKFMHGADKLLMVVTQLIEQIHPIGVIPTNESVARGIARIAMMKGSIGLRQLGLRTTSL